MGQQRTAIYENGYLRLLEPVSLSEGQQVQIVIETDEDERIRAALGDLVRWANPDDEGDDAWVEDEAKKIREELSGGKPLSQIIIEDRT